MAELGAGAHLILVGLPGSGKSTVGSAAARRLGLRFLDFDVEIEHQEGVSIATLFGEKGEPYFRHRELELTRELRGREGMVLAPGGGWITNPEVVALLRPPGRIIYLRATPEVALRRLGEGRASRPLLVRADPLAALRRLLAEREPLYASADWVIDTDLLDSQEVTARVVELARLVRSP